MDKETLRIMPSETPAIETQPSGDITSEYLLALRNKTQAGMSAVQQWPIGLPIGLPIGFMNGQLVAECTRRNKFRAHSVRCEPRSWKPPGTGFKTSCASLV